MRVRYLLCDAHPVLLSHHSSLAPNRRPAVAFVMPKYRAKAKSNRKQKKKEDPVPNPIEPGEYVVGA